MGTYEIRVGANTDARQALVVVASRGRSASEDGRNQETLCPSLAAVLEAFAKTKVAMTKGEELRRSPATGTPRC